MKSLAFALVILLPATALAFQPVSERDGGPTFQTFQGTAPKAAASPRRFIGRRMDIDFKRADIHNILRILADVGGVKIVTADDVNAQVNIRMRNAQWDEVLDVLARENGLAYERSGNTIRVHSSQ